MMHGNFWLVEPENEEEVLAMNDAVLAIRRQRYHEELVRKCQENITTVVEDSIDKIGLAETKTFLRGLVRELRQREEPD